MWHLLGLYELDEDGFLYELLGFLYELELLGFLYELEEEGLFELDEPLEPPFRDSISMKMSKNINSRMADWSQHAVRGNAVRTSCGVFLYSEDNGHWQSEESLL